MPDVAESFRWHRARERRGDAIVLIGATEGWLGQSASARERSCDAKEARRRLSILLTGAQDGRLRPDH